MIGFLILKPPPKTRSNRALAVLLLSCVEILLLLVYRATHSCFEKRELSFSPQLNTFAFGFTQ